MTALLQVRDLVVQYPGRRLGRPTTVIHGVDLELERGQTLGLVGESGSGKTTIGRAVLGLAPVSAGTIHFDGTELAGLGRRERRRVSRGIQVIFQDPYSSLNPSMTIEQILTEPLRAARVAGSRERVRGLLDDVGLPADAGRRLAREFSGGQRQRIAIARALALEPTLIVCDEPTSALDMSTQTRVLELLTELQQRTGVAYLFISHDLAVVQRMSHHTAVLLNGRVVELGTAEQVAEQPEHPYTQRLQMATPVPDPVAQELRRAQRLRMLAQQREVREHAGGDAELYPEP